MSAAASVLTVSGLRISFGDHVAVRNLSFSIQKGETLAIVGESGSGKSMTALAIMGLLPRTAATAGSIILDTGTGTAALHQIAEKEWRAIRGAAIGMIFQEPMSALNPVMSIGKQLQESITAHQAIGKKTAKKKAIEWLHKVKLPTPEKLFRRYPHQLSGGQKQRVMIAMAMCCQPALLIADEPTTALDATVQREVIALMKELQQEQDTAMIFITHDLALAADLSDHIMVLYQGNCEEYGPTLKVINTPEHTYTKALLACRPASRQKGERLPLVADFLNGTSAVAAPAAAPATDHRPLLRVQDLNIWYPEHRNLLGRTTGWFRAVQGVSFELHNGETLGLVGESGCGKSTLGRGLMGLAPVHSGRILLGDRELQTYKGAQWNTIRKSLQLIFQDPFASLNPRMRIADIIAEPLIVHHIMSPRAARQEAVRLLEQVQLPASAADRYPHQFSGGQRQRIGIARALALQPKVLICDESVSALDVSVQAQILNLLRDLQAELGLSYLFISHDLSVVHYISDRVMVMKDGQIIESGTADDIILRPQHPYTRQLIAAMPGHKISG